MKRLGLIGGIGPESTIAYYRAILAEYRRLTTDDGYPSVIINSVDLSRMRRLIERDDRPALADYLEDELRFLARAGATLGLLTANTPHLVFDEVQRRSSIPLVSIVEAARDAADSLHLRRVGLLGTRFTMQARFYPDVFSQSGIQLVVPPENEQAYVHEKYMTELVNGVFLPRTRDRLLEIVESARRRDGVDGVILAGTELPLILTGDTAFGIPLLDTTTIHARAAVRRLWGGEQT